MTHLEVENLASDYLEERLEPAPRAQVEAHLEACADCRELVADLGRVVERLQSAEELDPAPWLVAKILAATVGQRKPSLKEQLAAFFRPVVQPRAAYIVAMAVFSFSIIVNASGVNLRNLKLRDLNPRTWVYRANRSGHLLYARAEKFYYDVRVVYELESRFRRLRPQSTEPEKEAPKQESQPGGTTDRKRLAGPELASAGALHSADLMRSSTP